MFSSLVHLFNAESQNFIPLFNNFFSYPYLIKFDDFVDNSQEGMKHQTRGATQAQQAMTLQRTRILCTFCGSLLLVEISRE
jgi:hypothetical protein